MTRHCSQGDGKVCVWNDLWKILDNGDESLEAQFLKTVADMQSGPGADAGSRDRRCLSISSSGKSISESDRMHGK